MAPYVLCDRLDAINQLYHDTSCILDCKFRWKRWVCFKIHNSDQLLDYSTYLGGEGNDECRGIAVANIGGSEYAHVTGVTYSNTFPIQNPFEPFDEPNFGTTTLW